MTSAPLGLEAFTGTDLPRLSGLDAKLAAIVTPTLIDMGYELVRLAVLGRDRPTVQIMVDRADGTPIGIADCEAISHALGAVIDVADPMPKAWTLEVSSAGIDRPLTRRKDWTNHIGHLARVDLDLPLDGRKRLIGTILGAGPDAAEMRLEDGSTLAVPFTHMRKAKLVLTDALIDAATTPH